jgi:hypothetical protein
MVFSYGAVLPVSWLLHAFTRLLCRERKGVWMMLVAGLSRHTVA